MPRISSHFFSPRGRERLDISRDHLHLDPSADDHRLHGFAVWLYRGGCWELVADFCHEGYEPGPPPDEKGPCEGYAVRKECVLKPKKDPGHGHAH